MSCSKDCENKKNDNYLLKCDNLHQDDLHFVEKDLSYSEKISLGFLLYGAYPDYLTYILEKLLALKDDTSYTSSILFEYTRINKSKWKQCLIEALTITKCNRVLRKLGHDVESLKVTFLPHIRSTSIYIHSILKALYLVCEKLTPSDAGQIINNVVKNLNDNQKITFYNSDYFEIFLLHWMTLKLIDIGRWNPNEFIIESSPNLNLLTEELKVHGFELIKDELTASVKSFNQTNCNAMISKTIPITSNEEKLVKKMCPRVHCREKDGGTATASEFSNSLMSNKSSISSYRSSDSEKYLIRKVSAGYVLIFNQIEFYREADPKLQGLLSTEILKIREGTEKDASALKHTFENFGYVADIRENKTHIEMENIIKDVCQKSIVFDSIIICILSHGLKDHVYGCNSIPLEVQTINQILANSTSLLNKPKVLIIQACQGTELNKTKIVNYLEYDGPTKPLTTSGHYDILIAFSTIPGYASIRHTKEGSWFIQTLCRKINEFYDRKHIVDIFTIVINEISKKRRKDTECMVPTITQQLRKFFYFPTE